MTSMLAILVLGHMGSLYVKRVYQKTFLVLILLTAPISIKHGHSLFYPKDGMELEISVLDEQRSPLTA